MAQDLYYYESGYIDASYFVYTADAEAAVSSQATMTVAVGVIRGASTALTAQFTQTATISHIEGADLFALGEASIAVEVSRLRDNNIQASAQFSAATDISRIIHVSADDNVLVTLVGNFQRVRYSEAATSAAFSLTANIEKIPGGVVIQASGSWSVVADFDCKGTRKTNIVDADISAIFTSSVSGYRIRTSQETLFEVNVGFTPNVFVIASGASDQSAQASQTINANRLRESAVALSSQASQNSIVGIIKQFACDAGSLFTPSITCNAVVNTFAVLNSTANLQLTSISITKQLSAGLTSSANVTAVGLRIKSSAVSMSAVSSLSVPYTSFKNKRPYTVWQKTTGQALVPATSTFLDSSNYKYGTGSAVVTNIAGNGSNNYLVVSPSSTSTFTIGSNQDFIISLWVKGTYPGAVPSGAANFYPIFSINSNSTDWLSIGYFVNISGNWFWGSRIDGANSSYSQVGYTQENQWINLVLKRTGSSITFNTYGGNTNTTQTYTYSSGIAGGSVFLKSFARPTAESTIYFDEVFLAIGTNSIANYFDNSEIADGALSTTQFLYHFNGDFVDQTTGKQNAQAALASQATLSAVAGKNVSASTALSSQASLTARLNKLQQGAAGLQAQASELVAIGRIRPFVSIEDAQFSLSSAPVKTTRTTCDLASNAQLSATITKNIGPITASLASQTTLTANASSTTGIVINLEAFANSQLTVIGRIRPFASLETSAFSLSAQAQTVIVSAASLTSQASQSTTVTKTLGPIIANLTSQASVTVTVRALPSGSVQMSSQFTQTAQALRIKTSAVSVNSQAALNANAIVVKVATGTLTSQATLTGTALRIKRLQAALQVTGSELAVVVKTGRGLITLNSQATVSATAKVITGNNAHLDSTANLTLASSRVNKTFRAALQVNGFVLSDGDVGLFGQSQMSVQATATISAKKTARALAAINSTASVTCQLNKIQQGISLEASAGTLTVTVTRLRKAQAAISSQVTLSATPGKRVTAQATLSALGFVLSTGRIIDLTAAATWIVPAEITEWIIPRESRDWIIEEETREYTIKGL